MRTNAVAELCTVSVYREIDAWRRLSALSTRYPHIECVVRLVSLANWVPFNRRLKSGTNEGTAGRAYSPRHHAADEREAYNKDDPT